MKPSALLGEVRSDRQDGPWLQPVMWAGLIGGLAMLLLALETLLGFGEGVRATLQAVVGAALIAGLFNARQWNMSSEQARGDAPMPEETGKG